MTERDPFEILLRSNPVERDRLPEVSESVHGRALLEEIIDMAQPTTTTSRAPAPPSLRRPRRSRLLPAAAAAAALSLGFTVYAMNRDVTEPSGIGCYAQAHLDAKTVVVGADGRSPVAVCETVWGGGAFGREETPPLTACVLATGAVAVFPGAPETCDTLDLAPLDDAAYRAQAGGFIELRTALVDRFRAAGCLDGPAALDAVREELAARALSDWSVSTKGGFTAARPCASLAFDVEDQKVLLVPIPRSR